jgi:EAL domain-containing protein (putative c-di-GMP-specific phosphodiesterase class I)
VHYQPVFTMKDRQLVGAEALVRWRHPERGMVAPLDFVPIAEDSDLIAMLDHFVLREAATQMQRWRTEYPGRELFVAVNASRKQFVRPGFAEEVQKVLDDAGLLPGALHLEVTETVTMDPAPLVGTQLARVAEAGVQLVIDDFGVGYSSLAVLHRFPFRGLKVDRSFVLNLDHSAQATEVVRAILAMSNALGLCCTAEGVETQVQFDQLLGFGCKHVQGYLLARPMPAGQASDFLASAFAHRKFT